MTPPRSTLAPLDESLNVGEIIEFHRIQKNLGAAYSFPSASGPCDITHFEFARAAHRAAHLLRPGRAGPEGEVVAIVALTDALVYQTIVAGSILAGLSPFPISQRNTEDALIHLIKATDSHRLITTHASLGMLAKTISAHLASETYELVAEEAPTLAQLYPKLGGGFPDDDEDDFEPYPMPQARISIRARDVPSLQCTGLPKPIPISHRTFLSFGNLDALLEFPILAPRLACGGLPPFHALGMFMQLLNPLLNGTTCCLYPLSSGPGAVVVSPDSFLATCKNANVSGLITVPAFLVEWAKREQEIPYLASLSIVIFSGGPLPTEVGDYLVEKGVNLAQIYGSTECCGVTRLVRSPEVLASQWTWVEFSERVKIRWVPVNETTFEAQFLTSPTHYPAIENLPDVKGVSTKDLFERHPTNPNLYRPVGRLDHVIVMANGEKAVPGPFEDILNASAKINSAIMFGRGRNQLGVLVEPADSVRHVDAGDDEQVQRFRNEIWGVVEKANEVVPTFARVYKEMILITRPGVPMARAAKGTVINAATFTLYAEDIENLYAAIESSTNASDLAPPAAWSAVALERWLLEHATALASKEVVASADLFEQGFDSLNATFLRQRIVGALRNANLVVAARDVPQNLVYRYPTIPSLAGFVAGLVAGAQPATGTKAAKDAIEAMIEKYSLTSVKQQLPWTRTGTEVVLLTGSTGALGTHILESLLRNPLIKRVYVLNRPGRVPSAQRQEAAFGDRGLDVTVLKDPQLVFLEGDYTRDDLGLPEEIRTLLQSTLTIIVHNAWPVDFNKYLVTFEPQIAGMRNLLDLAGRTCNATRFVFASSIAAAQGWDGAKGPFPEELQNDASVAVGMGYGESKYVCERLLAASGLSGTSIRIGQVSGSPSNGAWSTTNWVPVVVKSSFAIGSFPSRPAAELSWIPPDVVARVVIDVALEGDAQLRATNLVHPCPVAWDTIFGALASDAGLPLVPIDEWVQRVEASAADATAEDLERIPAMKLAELLKDLLDGQGSTPQFEMGHVTQVSPTLATLEQLNEKDAGMWMKYWRAVKYLGCS
ncbi:Acetyl-CoA synthetase-like protein [Mycena kentingensis (nom. inval.)]|nr:Acetyl-CoA synthetase-like protein [Mycena kentingensis (nom. inval.)]